MIDDVFRPEPEKTHELGDRVLAMTGPQIDLRMIVQKAAFTIHSLESSALDETLEDNTLAEIKAPKKEKKLPRRALSMNGLDLSTLFPDLESLAEFIWSACRRVIW